MIPDMAEIIMAEFDESNFRSSDGNCSSLKDALGGVLAEPETRATGTDGEENAGLAAINIPNQEAVAVWFSWLLLDSEVQVRQRVIGHEAYHLAFFDDPHNGPLADSAAHYCFRAC